MMNFKIIETNYNNIELATDSLQSLLQTHKVVICSSSKFSLPSIERILIEYKMPSVIIDSITQAQIKSVSIAHYHVQKSFLVNDTYFFSEEAIFGKIVVSAKKKREVSTKKQLISANSYEVGNLVVHKKHGVARFDGLLLVKSQGKEYDTVKLTYAGGDVLYIPVTNIDYITKYGNIPEGVASENLLDKLSGTSFALRKAKVKKNLLEIADKLLKEAGKRKTTEASVFYENDAAHTFNEQFLFILTDDQSMAIKDCMEDLSSGKLMERLICGDVGFGKTEVAMRCCAIVTLGKSEGRYFGQVCIICPTTLLAMQHYKTFRQRFDGFDINIAKITRTTTAKERRQIIENLKTGEVDILIATHAGFNDEISFKNLELLVIDEEQHFGVQQKEKIKSKASCHTLLLSATPIPRTLQMGLSGLKDISIIATPPFDRLLPQTQVIAFDSIVLSNAIMREKQRGGRTFFVCPRVSDLEEQKVRILAITGGKVSVGIAHGGMPPAELEVIMDKFYTGVYDVLVTTSIVESGIDISFANTMILYRAEMFGLAALYQLRGRVGRGKVQSYVYFVVKDINRITDNAKQRLKVISSINSLGEGMKIAISDLDIRGAGNVVGKEQSGKINEVGVELYEQMLKEAVLESKNEVHNVDFDVEVKIAIPFFIPEKYIPDFSIRMQVYREISNINLVDDLLITQDDITDRFGKLPQQVINLIEIVKVKIRAKAQNIMKIEAGMKGVVLEFSSSFQKNDEILNAITKYPDKFQIKTATSIVCFNKEENLLKKAHDVLKWVEEL